jgi:hypothetical protein
MTISSYADAENSSTHLRQLERRADQAFRLSRPHHHEV